MHQKEAQHALDYLLKRGVMKPFKNTSLKNISQHQSMWGHEFGVKGKPTVEPEQVADRFLLLESIVKRLPKEASELNNRNYNIISGFVNQYVAIRFGEENPRKKLLNRYMCQQVIIEYLYQGGDLDKLSPESYEQLMQCLQDQDLKALNSLLKTEAFKKTKLKKIQGKDQVEVQAAFDYLKNNGYIVRENVNSLEKMYEFWCAPFAKTDHAITRKEVGDRLILGRKAAEKFFEETDLNLARRRNYYATRFVFDTSFREPDGSFKPNSRFNNAVKFRDLFKTQNHMLEAQARGLDINEIYPENEILDGLIDYGDQLMFGEGLDLLAVKMDIEARIERLQASGKLVIKDPSEIEKTFNALELHRYARIGDSKKTLALLRSLGH